MYRHKYEKYKSKYTQLKKLMYGGTPEEDVTSLTYCIYYSKTDDKYKGLGLFQSSAIINMKNKLSKNVKGKIIVNLYDLNFDCVLESIKIYEKDDNIAKIISKIEIKLVDKVILQMDCSDGKRIKSINNIYKDDTVIGIIDGQISKDKTDKYIVNSNELTINDDIKINCDLKSEMISGLRHIQVTNINQIKIKDCIFKFDPPYGTEMSIDNIIDLFTVREYSINEHIKKLIPGKIFKTKHLLKNIVSLFYKNYVFNLSNKCSVSTVELMKYGLFLSLLIEQDINKFGKQINELYDDLKIKTNFLSNSEKTLPSYLKISDISFKKKDGSFINLPTATEILIDSGNSNFTVIGSHIVDMLGLDRFDGCIRSIGFGEHSTICNGYVILEFKFSDTYAISDDKIYKCIAFIDNISIDEIILGHTGTLNLLFNDNYTIKNKYVDTKDTNIDVISLREETHKTENSINTDLEKIFHDCGVAYGKTWNMPFSEIEEIINRIMKEKKWMITFKFPEYYKIVNNLENITKMLLRFPNQTSYVTSMISSLENLTKKMKDTT